MSRHVPVQARRMSVDIRFLHRMIRPSTCRRRNKESWLRVVMMMMLGGDVVVSLKSLSCL
jgi:hypothetical protein